MNSKIISCDFDNVICKTERFIEGEITGKPIKGALNSIIDLINAGYIPVVFTSRTNLRAVSDWLSKNGFPLLQITREKPIARAFIDDRAIRFTNWNDIVRYFI